MKKKGKFKLLSYIIDENLIYYTSLNRNKKIIAFSLLEIEDFNSIYLILNKFLKKRYINYYSIQIQINSIQIKKIILLNFKDQSKTEIIKLFHLIKKTLINKDFQVKFLKKEQLEKTFLKIINKNMNFNIQITKKFDLIFIKNEKTSIFLDFYNINFEYLEKKSSFIHNFTKLIKNFNRKGYLIFNFKNNNSKDIILSAYFVEMKKKSKTSMNIETEMNNFFNYHLLKKQNVDLKVIPPFLWRSHIYNNFFLFKDVLDLFLIKNQYSLHDFENKLLKNQIEYKRLNKNLIFIEQHFLFLQLQILNLKVILDIIKKYYSRFFIYILILNEKDYIKLLKIDKISLLKNIKILNPDNFFNFDINVFKKNLLLENTQSVVFKEHNVIQKSINLS